MSISIEGTLSKVREIGHFRESLVTLLIWIAILDITWQCETYKYFLHRFNFTAGVESECLFLRPFVNFNKRPQLAGSYCTHRQSPNWHFKPLGTFIRSKMYSSCFTIEIINYIFNPNVSAKSRTPSLLKL